MSGFTLYLADTTRQGGRVDTYDDQDIKTHVVQHDGRRGPMDAQMMAGVGFASVPVPGDRLLIMQKSGNLYAIAGASQPGEEALGLGQGDRAIYSTDFDQALKSVLKILANGTTELGTSGAPEITTDNGNTSIAGTAEISDNTTVGGAGALPVAIADAIDKYFVVVDSMLTAVDPLVGGVYAGLKTAAFPPSGAIPSVAAKKLNSE